MDDGCRWTSRSSSRVHFWKHPHLAFHLASASGGRRQRGDQTPGEKSHRVRGRCLTCWYLGNDSVGQLNLKRTACPLKMNGWKINFLFGISICLRGYDSFTPISVVKPQSGWWFQWLCFIFTPIWALIWGRFPIIWLTFFSNELNPIQLDMDNDPTNL